MPRSMRVLTGALAVLAVAVPTSPAAAQQVRVEAETFQLPNGLTVILHRDTTTPTIATNIWYHVGSSHERPGRTGFAHLFEHIMFEGSKNVPEGKIDEWFAEVGGAPNGSTTTDRTNYMQSRSEERRVGKECRYGWWPEHQEHKEKRNHVGNRRGHDD